MRRSTPNYDRCHLRLTDMSASHLDGLHALSASVGWPHRRDDWAAIMAAGNGVVAVDLSDRVHGSAMHFSLGAGERSAIGMVIAHPRLRLSGIGKRLVANISEHAYERPRMLNACREDVGFYRSLGAKIDRQIFQHQGIVIPMGTAVTCCRPAMVSDMTDIISLDAEAAGVNRSALVLEFANLSVTYVLRRRGRLVGFAMRRPFGRGYLVGPVIATQEENAIELVTALLFGLGGCFVRVDTPVNHGQYRGFLNACGLAPAKGVVHMTMGSVRKQMGELVYGLASHSTG